MANKSAQQLIEDARRRMQQIYEYSFYSHGTYEAGEQNQDPMAAGAAAPGGDQMAAGAGAAQGADQMTAGAAAPGTDPMAGAGAAQGADPNAAGAGLAPNAGMPDGQNAAGGDPNAMGGDPMGSDPMGGGMPGDPMGGGNDNVIEISQLTDTQQQMQQAQDEQSEKLDDVDKKITTLMSIVDKFTQALSANDEKIGELKRELQKRTPTEEETMNVRLHAGGNPFEEKPEEFWDKFQDINNHYNITANNEPPQYQIKKSDIDNVNDRLVGNGFDEDELDKIPNTLREYFTR